MTGVDGILQERRLVMIELRYTILRPPNWDTPFEIMCDTSDYAVGAILGQRIEKQTTRDLLRK